MTDKKIPLHEEHVKLGAKMVPFGGYIMPVQYKLGILKEHKTVRESVGIFDISHMGEVIIKGKDAESFLQYIMVNDLKLLYDGKAQYSCICYDNGTVVDDCFYYRYSPEEFRIILNASNIEKDIEWFNSHKNNFSVTINDVSKSRGRFALQGPKAKDTIAPLIIDDISELKRFHFMETKLNGIDIFIAFTGYTGENGYEISFEVEKSIDILHAILKSGEKYNISLIGLGARDTLRLEACYSLYGHELTDKITPIEAGIGFCVKNKEMPFIGKEVLLKQKKEGTINKIVGIELIDRGIIRDHYKVFSVDGENQIGYITSGTFSPTFKKSIGLALLQTEFSQINTQVNIEIRNKMAKAKVVAIPFYKFGGGN